MGSRYCVRCQAPPRESLIKLYRNTGSYIKTITLMRQPLCKKCENELELTLRHTINEFLQGVPNG